MWLRRQCLCHREVKSGGVRFQSPPHEPWDTSEGRESLLERVKESAPFSISQGRGAGRAIDRKEVEALSAGPWDDGMSAPLERGATMYLQRPPDEDGRASAAALISTSVGWIPTAVPTRLASHELQALEAGAKVAMFLQEKDSTGLM